MKNWNEKNWKKIEIKKNEIKKIEKNIEIKKKKLKNWKQYWNLKKWNVRKIEINKKNIKFSLISSKWICIEIELIKRLKRQCHWKWENQLLTDFVYSPLKARSANLHVGSQVECPKINSLSWKNGGRKSR